MGILQQLIQNGQQPIDQNQAASFAQAQQPQQSQGIVPDILSARFAPSMQDVGNADFQTGINHSLVTPQTVELQRLAPLMKLSELQQQQEQTRAMQMKNQMTAFQMPLMQSTMQRLYGQGQPQNISAQMQANAAQQPGAQSQPMQGNAVPYQEDQRITMAKLAAGMGNEGLSKAYMQDYENDPNVIARKATITSESQKTGDNTAEANKTLNVMQANLPTVLQRLSQMKGAATDASYGFGVNGEGEGFKQQYHNQINDSTSQANAILRQRAAQGVLPELGPQLAQAGIKGNKFLETLSSSASGLNLGDSPDAKQAAIEGLKQQYINNLKSTARQVTQYGGKAPSEADIDAAVAQFEKSSGISSQPVNAVQTPALTPELARQEAIRRGLLK